MDKASGKSVYTGSVILNFESEEKNVPSHIEYGKIFISVNIMVPRPRIFFHCGILGHSKDRCIRKDKELCQRCFHDHKMGVA